MPNTIYPCFWFNQNAKQAAEFYCTVFPDTHITSENQFVVNFESASQKFMCINGGPAFSLNPSISIYVVMDTEQEVDESWNKLMEGGMAMMPLDKYPWSEKYGWVQDKFGVTWQLSYGKLEDVGQKFTPVLMFVNDQHGRAEEAIHHYTSIFNNSSVRGILRYEAHEVVEGTIKHAQFTLDGNVMMAMDSGHPHQFNFSEGISLVVECNTQQEIDHFWDNLSEGGEPGRCGWLKDKFRVSWQVIPKVLGKLVMDPERSGRVIQAFMQMNKFDIEALENA
jgi:predicted 3-demethylubiquinone-9 3-methyltransferase (glyoxalase superfamily)